MSFLYIGNATYLNPDHIVRIRATKVAGQCELVSSNNAVYVIPFDFLNRAHVSLKQISDKLREYEEQQQKCLTDEQRHNIPRDQRPRSTREILDSIVAYRETV